MRVGFVARLTCLPRIADSRAGHRLRLETSRDLHWESVDQSHSGTTDQMLVGDNKCTSLRWFGISMCDFTLAARTVSIDVSKAG
jgi:hypothetical protein